MKNESVVVAFRTSETVNELFEKTAKKKGRTKSEFILMAAMDAILDFDKVRHQDTICKFCISITPFLTRNMSQDEANKFIEELGAMQNEYTQKMLGAHMTLQRHLTDVSIRSFLQDYMEDMAGMNDQDTFIIHQCLVTIYDYLYQNGLLSEEEWREKTLFYENYMNETGSKLI